MVLTSKEVVETYLIEGGSRSIGGDVSTNPNARPLGPMNHNRSIPAKQTSIASLQIDIARVFSFLGDGNGVDEIRGPQTWYCYMAFTRTLKQAQCDIAGTLNSRIADKSIKGL
jgi:hypothetical protein